MKNEANRWTIYDIARAAGVSAKTVSRVLNGKSGVGNETRSRILELIERTGYHPHSGARALRGVETRCIGVTLPASVDEVPISQGFTVWLFSEMHRVFGAHGEYLTFDLNPYDDGRGWDYGRGVWEHLFKACVVAGPLRVGDQVIGRIHDSGVPYLALGRLDSLPEVSSAVVDYEEGAYVSAKFLLDRGHKRIAMIKAFSGFQPGVERRRGYLRALEEAGIAPDADLMRTVTFGASNITNVVHHLLSDPEVTALIDCSATEDASSLREGARRAGRVPGKNFEIVAWTYETNAAVLSEASAHVWLPAREVATEGLEQLAAWLHGERDGPIKLVYRPILSEEVAKGEVPKPRRLFELLE